jgi:integrase
VVDDDQQETDKLATVLNKLTDLEVRNATPGRLSDGGNLYLQTSPGGSKAWLFIYRWHGRTRQAGLGSLTKLTLAKARKRAAEGRELLGDNQDPLEVWRAEKRAKEVPTFAEMAAQYFEDHRSEWRSDRHAREWLRSLDAYCRPLNKLPVNQISAGDVYACLRALWNKRPETLSRVRGRIFVVISAAKAAGFIDEHKTNPATWVDGLKHRLAKKPDPVNHRSLPYQKMGAFMRDLRSRRFTSDGGVNVPAFALEWTILTAARSGEVLGATWNEVGTDEDGNPVWRIPKQRTKRFREHVVPLSISAVAILTEMEVIRGTPFTIPGRDGKPDRHCAPYIFPGHIDNRPLGGMAFITLLRAMKDWTELTTTHGFRSTFRTWCGNEVNVPRDIAEQALAHQVGDKTERAYSRGDALKKRRALMEAWSAYLAPSPAGNVIDLAKRA